jgi:HTH-type transcriptional regulator/antitoxin HigA
LEEDMMNLVSTTTTSQANAKSGIPRRRDMRLAVWAIRNERDYDRARDVVDDLVMRPRLSREDRERLEVMMALMESYEAKHHAIDASGIGPIELLKALMKDHAMTASDLGRLLGSRALGSLILNGKRELSKTHIRVLSEHFALNPSAFF